MLRNHCATYPGITVRHGADFAKDAYIYLSFVRKKADELQKIATEIDEDYESEDQISENSA
jgi:hypothetical protein